MVFQTKYLSLFRLILNRCKKTHFHWSHVLSILTVLSLARRKSVVKNTRRKGFIVRNAQRFKVRPLVLIFFIFFASNSNAQSVEISAGFNRLDYQIGVAYGHRWNHFHVTSKIEVGPTSTFAQGRIFPRLSIGSSYFLVRKGIVDFGPEFVYAYSRQRITAQAKTAHHWNEFNLGYRLQVGRTIKFVHSLNGGLINESFYSNALEKRVNFNSLGIYAQIGVSYTF